MRFKVLSFNKAKIAAACLWILLILLAKAVDAQQNFKKWTTEDGLPQNNVINIAQTPDGYLWVATLDGLARFDGVRFKVFNKSNTPEMPNNRIFEMFTDTDGRLWFNYPEDRSVVVYENGKFKRFEKGRDFEKDENLTLNVSYGTERYRHLLRKPEMTFRAGETEYVYEAGRFLAGPARESEFPAKVFATDDKSVWIDDGQAIYHIEGEKVTRYPKNQPLPVSPKNTIPMDYAERDGVIWCAAGITLVNGKLISFKNGNVKLFPKVNQIYELEFDAKGNLLIADFKGIIKVDAATIRLNEPSNFPVPTPSPEKAATIFRDKDNNLWFGGSQGLYLNNLESAVTFYSDKSQPSLENVYPIVQDAEGTVWFAAWKNNRLFSYRDGDFKSEYGFILTALFVDSRSRLWKGTGGGIEYRENNRWIPFDYEKTLPSPWNKPDVFTGELSFITEDKQGVMWFGTEAGVIRYADGVSRLFTVDDGLPANVVTSYLFTRSGEMWIGTNAGIARMENGRFRAFTEADGLAGNYTRSFYEDADGSVWIGGYDGGLTRFKNGEFKKISKSDGLFSDGVFVILEDDAGWFWMNSNQGVYRVRRQELNDFADGRIESVTSVSYGPEDGLLEVEGNGGKQPAGLKARDGRLWFPMAKGVAVINPSTAKPETAPPPVLIEETRIDGKPFDVSEGGVSLNSDQVALEIDYTALGFAGAERMRFRYRLENLDEEWTEAGTRRTAYFSHLPAGEYVFQVIAANYDGVWNNEGAFVKIVIVPPFYRKWWFYALAVVGTFGLITLIYFLRLRQLQALGETRAEFARRLIESQEGERHRIALELHDSIGQTLAVIRNRTLLGLDAEEIGKMREQLNQISEASTLALQETREIARNLHPAQIENLGLTAALRSLVKSIESATGLRCEAYIDEISQNLSYDASINIYRITQESLSNIIKHSGASKACVRLQIENEKLVLTVEDDGRGFDDGAAPYGLGLTGMCERARMIDAELTIDSHPGEGTKIRLVL
jgi:signal transduction histidine kinase/ligand-binding sensor domain-containing protein